MKPNNKKEIGNGSHAKEFNLGKFRVRQPEVALEKISLSRQALKKALQLASLQTSGKDLIRSDQTELKIEKTVGNIERTEGTTEKTGQSTTEKAGPARLLYSTANASSHQLSIDSYTERRKTKVYVNNNNLEKKKRKISEAWSVNPSLSSPPKAKHGPAKTSANIRKTSSNAGPKSLPQLSKESQFTVKSNIMLHQKSDLKSRKDSWTKSESRKQQRGIAPQKRKNRTKSQDTADRLKIAAAAGAATTAVPRQQRSTSQDSPPTAARPGATLFSSTSVEALKSYLVAKYNQKGGVARQPPPAPPPKAEEPVHAADDRKSVRARVDSPKHLASNNEDFSKEISNLGDNTSPKEEVTVYETEHKKDINPKVDQNIEIKAKGQYLDNPCDNNGTLLTCDRLLPTESISLEIHSSKPLSDKVENKTAVHVPENESNVSEPPSAFDPRLTVKLAADASIKVEPTTPTRFAAKTMIKQEECSYSPPKTEAAYLRPTVKGEQKGTSRLDEYYEFVDADTKDLKRAEEYREDFENGCSVSKTDQLTIRDSTFSSAKIGIWKPTCSG